MWATTKKLPASFFRFPSSPAKKAIRTNKRSSSTKPNLTFRLMTRPSNFQPRNSIYAFHHPCFDLPNAHELRSFGWERSALQFSDNIRSGCAQYRVSDDERTHFRHRRRE